MPLSSSESRRIANVWLREQESFPLGRRVIPRAYEKELERRLFSVMYREDRLGKDFCLMEFFVYDDRSVELGRDRREDVQKLLNKHGFALHKPVRTISHDEALKRFITIAQASKPELPGWLDGIERVDASSHSDALAIIVPSKGSALHVRVKIATSVYGKARICSNITPKKMERTVVMVVTPDKSDDQIRDHFLHLLTEIRKKWLRE